MLAGVEDTEDYKFISEQILLSMNERIDTLIKINKENNSDYSKYIEFFCGFTKKVIFKLKQLTLFVNVIILL